MKRKSGNSKGDRVIYRPWITTKSGKRIYAYQYGLRAFRIVIKAA